MSARKYPKGLSREFSAWTVMKRRCSEPGFKDWKYYGAKGITVCSEWAESFQSFLADVGRAPTPTSWLGRLNTAGNYEPGNVAWTSHDPQVRRRQWCRKVNIAGQQLTIAEAERAVGLEDGTLRHRLNVGIPLAEALTRKVCRTGRPPKTFTNQPKEKTSCATNKR